MEPGNASFAKICLYVGFINRGDSIKTLVNFVGFRIAKCAHAHMHTQTLGSEDMQACRHAGMQACRHTHMHKNMHDYMHGHMYTNMHTYIHMYIDTDIHT